MSILDMALLSITWVLTFAEHVSATIEAPAVGLPVLRMTGGWSTEVSLQVAAVPPAKRSRTPFAV